MNSQRTLMASIEQLVQKIHGGVVINFEKVGPDPPAIIPSEETPTVTSNGNGNGSNSNNGHLSSNCAFLNGQSNPQFFNGDISSWQNTKNFIYVQRSAQKGYSVGHWPIPESFWPDTSLPSLPPRTAHPVVKFTCANSDPMIIDNLPFDKYELEPSPLTQYILSRKQPLVAWQVFVSNSHKSSELGLPFGYLKASTSLTCVNLFVLPYNYPVLLPLLEDLFKTHQRQPSLEWKVQFDAYFKNMPLYYVGPLKRALQRMGATPNLVPDNMDNYLSYTVLNYLKRLKNQAKVEFDKLVGLVGTVKQSIPEGTRIFNSSLSVKRMSEFGLKSNRVPSQRFANLKNELNDFQEFVIRISDKQGNIENRTQCYRNSFDIERHELLDQIARMRRNFLQHHTSGIRYQDEDQQHSLPISQMGNYQEYLKRMPRALRELESTPVRQHMFGNPFKIDKRGMMIDEADIDLVGGGGNPAMNRKRVLPPDALAGPKPKRKPGPLPRDFAIQRPYSPSSPMSLTPPPSPLSSPPASPLPSTSSMPNSSPASPVTAATHLSPASQPSYSTSATTSTSTPHISPVPTSSVTANEFPKVTSNGTMALNSTKESTKLANNVNFANEEAPQRKPSPELSAQKVTENVSNHTSDVAAVQILNNHLDRTDEKVEASNPTLSDYTGHVQTNNSNYINNAEASNNPLLRAANQTSSQISPVNGRVANSHSETTASVNYSEHNGTCLNEPTAKSRLVLTSDEIEIKKRLCKLVRRPGRGNHFSLPAKLFN